MTINVAEFQKYGGPDRVVHWNDYLLEKAGQSNSGKNFRSSFAQFDKKMGGIETGEVVVISGETKQGKTLFAESWLRDIRTMDNTAKPLILTFEVQAEKLLAKYMGNNDDQIYLPLDLKTMDFEWLRKRCIEAIVKFNCNILMIDHLHFMVDMNTRQNMSLNIGAFMRRLKKDIAIDLNMAVVLIAHQSQTKDGQTASIRSIRDSSFVGQEADSVIVVWRRKNFDSVELEDIRRKKGDDVAEEFKRMKLEGESDEYSMNLAVVSIERTRRTGVYEYRKLFRKNREFLEEV